VITSHIQIILIITGVLTATTLIQFIAPSWVLHHLYGEVPTGAAGIALARHWGLLLFCVGMLLIYSAFYPPLRDAAVVVASVEKVGFVALVGTSLYQRPIALLMAAGDAVMVLFFALYLARV
jgi:hypothetical protein